MEKLMEVLEVHNTDKHGVILLGQNEDLDVLSEDKLKQYIGDSITLRLTNGDEYKLKVINIDRMYPCFSPESPLIIGICVGHTIDAVNVKRGSVVYISKNNPMEYFQVLCEDSGMDEQTRYIFNNYSNLMTIQENMAWRYFIFKTKGHMDLAKSLESNQRISMLINLGEEAFYAYVKKRILKEHSDIVVLNYCPKCGNLTRTPKAKQCLKCKHDWH